MQMDDARETRRYWGLSRNTFVLGWVSFFTDVASEMIYALLPMFLVDVLGANKSLVGLIEGVAESTASLLKIVSGWIADKTGHSKLLITLGYGISALSRPFYALVAGPWGVLALRFTDRVGKGIRTAPRDALIVATSDPAQLGRSFGFHRAMDQTGAILGPLLATLLLPVFGGHYPSVFVASALPGFLAVLLIVAAVRDVPRDAAHYKAPPTLHWRLFDWRFRLFVAAAFVFALGNSSTAFLLLRAHSLGIPTALVPIAYMVSNAVYVLASVPAGIVSDRIGRARVLLIGYVVFALTYAGFALATTSWQAWALFAVYGLYSGLSEGVQRAMVGELAPERLKGSGFGVYHLAVGLAALPASLLTGFVWDRAGARVAFGVDAVLAIAALLLFSGAFFCHRQPE